jgi:hypothetical protein
MYTRWTHLRDSLVLPIILWLIPKLNEGAGAVDQGVVQAVSSSLDDANRDIWIFAEASSDNETGSATTDNNVVIRLTCEVFHRHFGVVEN